MEKKKRNRKKTGVKISTIEKHAEDLDKILKDYNNDREIDIEEEEENLKIW